MYPLGQSADTQDNEEQDRKPHGQKQVQRDVACLADFPERHRGERTRPGVAKFLPYRRW